MEAIPDMDNTFVEMALQTAALSPTLPPDEQALDRLAPAEKYRGRFKVRPLEPAASVADSAAAAAAGGGAALSQDRRRDEQERVKKRVSFPEGEALIKGYAHAPNPWYNVTQCTPENLVAAYTSSCEKHSVKPIQKLLSQLKRIQDFTERSPLLELRGENVTLKHVETLEEIFKRIQFVVIDLESCHLDDESSTALFDMVEYYESAMHLKVSSNKGIGARGWMACARMIRKTPCLEILETKGCAFGEQGLPALGRSLRLGAHVAVLHMEDCGLASRGLMILAAALRMCDTVRELYLGENNLQAADGLQLGNLIRNNHVLDLLDLRNNHLQDAGAVHIFDALACQATFDQRLLHTHTARQAAVPPLPHQQGSRRGLLTLILRNNGVTFHSMASLASALVRNTALQTLNLGQNNITDEGIFTLKDGLLQNKSVVNLYLPQTKISCEGAVALAEYIADSVNIRHLDLQENDIKTAGLLALSMCVKVQRTVTHIDLDSTPKKESAIKDYANQQRGFLEEIAAQLQHNRQLEAERQTRAAAVVAAALAAAAASEMAVAAINDGCAGEPAQDEQQQQPPAGCDSNGDHASAAAPAAGVAVGSSDAAADRLACPAPSTERPLVSTPPARVSQGTAVLLPAVQPTAAAINTSPLYLSVENLLPHANGFGDHAFSYVHPGSQLPADSLPGSEGGQRFEVAGSASSHFWPQPAEMSVSANGADMSEETVLYDSANMVLDLETTLINASLCDAPPSPAAADRYHHSVDQSVLRSDGLPVAEHQSPSAGACLLDECPSSLAAGDPAATPDARGWPDDEAEDLPWPTNGFLPQPVPEIVAAASTVAAWPESLSEKDVTPPRVVTNSFSESPRASGSVSNAAGSLCCVDLEPSPIGRAGDDGGAPTAATAQSSVFIASCEDAIAATAEDSSGDPVANSGDDVLFASGAEKSLSAADDRTEAKSPTMPLSPAAEAPVSAASCPTAESDAAAVVPCDLSTAFTLPMSEAAVTHAPAAADAAEQAAAAAEQADKSCPGAPEASDAATAAATAIELSDAPCPGAHAASDAATAAAATELTEASWSCTGAAAMSDASAAAAAAERERSDASCPRASAALESVSATLAVSAVSPAAAAACHASGELPDAIGGAVDNVTEESGSAATSSSFSSLANPVGAATFFREEQPTAGFESTAGNEVLATESSLPLLAAAAATAGVDATPAADAVNNTPADRPQVPAEVDSHWHSSSSSEAVQSAAPFAAACQLACNDSATSCAPTDPLNRGEQRSDGDRPFESTIATCDAADHTAPLQVNNGSNSSNTSQLYVGDAPCPPRAESSVDVVAAHVVGAVASGDLGIAAGSTLPSDLSYPDDSRACTAAGTAAVEPPMLDYVASLHDQTLSEPLDESSTPLSRLGSHAAADG